jgi:hypothetical protein
MMIALALGAAALIAVFLLVTTAIRRYYTDPYWFHRRVASRELLAAMAEEARQRQISLTVIVDRHGRPLSPTDRP